MFSYQGSLVNTLKEVRPTAFMGVPRVWEKMQEKMKAVGAKSSTVRRKVAAWAKDVGLQTNLAKMNQYVHVTTVNYMLILTMLYQLLHRTFRSSFQAMFTQQCFSFETVLRAEYNVVITISMHTSLQEKPETL